MARNVSLFSMPMWSEANSSIQLICFILFMLIVEWINRNQSHGLVLTIKQKWIRLLIYFVLIFAIIFNFGQEQTFIYFQL